MGSCFFSVFATTSFLLHTDSGLTWRMTMFSGKGTSLSIAEFDVVGLPVVVFDEFTNPGQL